MIYYEEVCYAWLLYNFSYLVLYTTQRVKGELSLANIAEVKASESGSEFSLEIFFEGKEDPAMKLIAPSKVYVK